MQQQKEWLKQYPELTVYDNDDPTQAVNTVQYLSLIPLLVKEMQVQKGRIDVLNTQLTAMQNQYNALQLQVNSLLNVGIRL